jgi:hypothetical protein
MVASDIVHRAARHPGDDDGLLIAGADIGVGGSGETTAT